MSFLHELSSFKQKYVWFYISGCGEGITYQIIQYDATRKHQNQESTMLIV